MTQPATARQDAPARPDDEASLSGQPAVSPTARRRLTTGTGATLVLAVTSVAGAGAAHADEQYTVQSGDTVSHIALRSGVPAAEIVRANNLPSSAAVRIGQTLTIPTGTAPAPAPAAPSAATYTVAAGDTVSGIAAKHGTTVAAVAAANGLDARAFIRIGQTLTIPGAASAPAPATAPATRTAATYTVVAGDTVSRIAARHGTTVAAISAANGLDARALVRIGQTLTIPGAVPTTQLVGNTFAGRTYSDAVVASANANKATLLAMGVPSRAAMQAKVAATARAMGVDPSLAQAIAYQESGFNHTAVSPANAIGAMQVIPSSGEWAGQLVGRQLNLLNPDDNVVAGVAILRQLVRTSPDLPTAIAGYYQGLSSVKRNGMFADTRRYVASIQTHMTRFG